MEVQDFPGPQEREVADGPEFEAEPDEPMEKLVRLRTLSSSSPPHRSHFISILSEPVRMNSWMLSQFVHRNSKIGNFFSSTSYDSKSSGRFKGKMRPGFRRDDGYAISP
jgi:hypothetical protein